MAILTLKCNNNELSTYKLNNESLTIGRLNDNDIVIDNKGVSGHHANILFDDTGFLIEDLGSTNGTFVNEKPIKTSRLRNGDVITIGKHELIFDNRETNLEIDAQDLSKETKTTINAEDKTGFLDTQKLKNLREKDDQLGDKVPLLIVKFKEKELFKYLLKNKLTKIGRGDKNNVIIDNTAISNNHASITWNENGFSIDDMNSRNGTFLNEKQIHSHQLIHGDVIKIGKHEIIFEEYGNFTIADLQSSTANAASEFSAPDQTTFIDTKNQQNIFGKNSIKVPTITFIKGGKGEVAIEKKIIKIGKSANSDIIVKGLLVGKTAAVINLRPDGYYLAYCKGLFKPNVNGNKVKKSVKLTGSDKIIIGSSIFRFTLSLLPFGFLI